MTKFIEPLLQSFPEFRWTLERYHDLIRAGIFTTADKIELLYGKIVDKIPSGGTHAECVQIVADYFRERFLGKYTIREEKPVTFSSYDSEPEPDVAIVTKKKYAPDHPTEVDIHFIAEVSQKSLRKDQTIKVVLYAEAGIREYWIINLDKRRIEVHIDPLPEEGAYGSVNNHGEEVTFTSPFAGVVKVKDLLPGVGSGEAS